MSGKENYKSFQAQKKREIGLCLLKIVSHHGENQRYAVLLRVHLCAYTHVYTRREEEEKPPEAGGFSLAPLQNVGGLLYFCLGGKEANGPGWEGGGGCTDAQEAEAWRSFCIGSAALPKPPARAPSPSSAPGPNAYLRYGGFLTPPAVWQPAAVYCITGPLHKRILGKDQIINSE